ncbi:hypothetical protein FHR37_003442 [Actinopolymorpha cephalotaxi]|uniref:Uncharacterized protein n=1 Tax=Actinopolymorpha cephalotaxi TaxID=504797 RepID=A0ABX2S4N6_9ACTN|nr:hypothetical protein [Actinopolymorpha cephalotaxi]
MLNVRTRATMVNSGYQRYFHCALYQPVQPK